MSVTGSSATSLMAKFLFTLIQIMWFQSLMARRKDSISHSWTVELLINLMADEFKWKMRCWRFYEILSAVRLTSSCLKLQYLCMQPNETMAFQSTMLTRGHCWNNESGCVSKSQMHTTQSLYESCGLIKLGAMTALFGFDFLPLSVSRQIWLSCNPVHHIPEEGETISLWTAVSWTAFTFL